MTYSAAFCLAECEMGVTLLAIESGSSAWSVEKSLDMQTAHILEVCADYQNIYSVWHIFLQEVINMDLPGKTFFENRDRLL